MITILAFYLLIKKKDEARKSFIEAIKINKDYAPSFSNLGRCYEMLNMPEESLECFEQAIVIDPNSFIVLNNLAGYYLDKGLYKKDHVAIKELKFLIGNDEERIQKFREFQQEAWVMR